MTTSQSDHFGLAIIHVVGAIIVRDGRILATQRGYGDYAGWWEFPGGKVDPGESPEDALVREIREELNAGITIDRYFDTTEYDYPKFHLSMRCYLCSLKSNTPGQQPGTPDYHLSEHQAAKWTGRDDIYDLKWLGADIPIIEKLIAEGVI